MTKTVINDIQMIYEGQSSINFPPWKGGPFAADPPITGGAVRKVAPLPSPLKGPPVAPAPTSKIAAPSEGPAINTDEELENIARDVLGIKTLKVRNMDDLDFYEVHVANLKKALQQAFQAGQLSHS